MIRLNLLRSRAAPLCLGLSALLLTTCDPGPKGSTESATTAGPDSASSTSMGSDTSVLACEDYESVDSTGPSVTINVTNSSGATLYFKPVGCSGVLPMSFEDAMGESFSWRNTSNCFPTSCDQFLVEPDCSIGCADCIDLDTGLLQAGGAGSVQWSGSILTKLEMTPECGPGVNCDRTCDRLDQAPDGTYTAKFTAYGSCTGPCDCEPINPGEPCATYSPDANLSDPVTYEVTFEYPAQTEVTIDLTP